MEAEEQVQETEVPQIEQDARSMGWLPKEEFKGDPDKWRPADEYVERGTKILPIVQENNRRLQNDIKELRGLVQHMVQNQDSISKREYDRARKDLERAREEAVELGDKARFHAVESEMADLEKVRPDTARSGSVDEIKQKDVEAFTEFTKANPWFGKDRARTAYMREMANEIESQKPHLLGTPDLYKEALAAVKEEFPHKFTNPKRDEPGSVHTGDGEGGGKGKKGHTFNDLPAEERQEARKQYEIGKKQGLFKTEADYLNLLPWEA